ncbi:MAG: DUF2059 domain-containing protein [Pseudomonadota bacterium]
MNFRFGLYISLLLAAGAPALAAPDAQQVAAAERLLAAQDYDSTLDRTINALTDEMKRSFADRVNRDLAAPAPPGLVTKVQDIIERHLRVYFAQSRGQMKRATALIYANHFTVAELDRLAVIQRDPAMRKLQLEAPQIAVETMGLSQAAWATSEPALKAEIESVMRDYLKSKGKPPGS